MGLLNKPFDRRKRVDSLQTRLDQIKMKGVSLAPSQSDTLVRDKVTLEVDVTEKQLEHIKAHFRMLRIRFKIL